MTATTDGRCLQGTGVVPVLLQEDLHLTMTSVHTDADGDECLALPSNKAPPWGYQGFFSFCLTNLRMGSYCWQQPFFQFLEETISEAGESQVGR